MMCIVLLLLVPTWAAKRAPKPATPAPPDLLLEGGRKLSFERTFRSERELHKPGFWGKMLDVVAGEAQYHELIRPYSIAVDSHGRAIITDPGAAGIHIFDLTQNKYKFVERKDKDKDPMLAPQCVAVDDQNNIYVTDSSVGKIFVFGADGKFKRAIGSLKGGEGYFKRPTGIAVDSAAQRIYVTDTLRNKIFVLDMQGQVLESFGQSGVGNLEFNFPTELRINGEQLVVVDAMNFRVQTLTRSGKFVSVIGEAGDTGGSMFRPKGVAVDSEGHLYIVDGLLSAVQVFNHEGQMLYSFGTKGSALGQFELPAGLFIDKTDRVFVVDSYNRRVQVFRYYGLGKHAAGERP
jgi:DNA-binding beta-propeller fold protein YncE